MGIREDERIIYNSAAQEVNKRNEQILKAYEKSIKNIEEKILEVKIKSIKGETLTQRDIEKVFRLQEIYKQIDSEVVKLRSVMRKAITDGYKSNYETTYYYEAYTFEKSLNLDLNLGANYSLNYPALNTKAVEASFNPGAIDSIKGVSDQFSASVKNLIANSIIEGKSVDRLAKDIMAIEDLGKNAVSRAQRISRTELLKAYSLGQEEAAKEAEESGVEFEYIWKSTLDSKTRRDHVNEDNKKAIIVYGNPVFIISGVRLSSPRVVAGSNTASDKQIKGQVINCRCRRINAPFGITPTKRAAKKPNGTWVTVDSNTSARDWIKENYPDARVNNIKIEVAK